jgi:hypothetical protein
LNPSKRVRKKEYNLEGRGIDRKTSDQRRTGTKKKEDKRETSERDDTIERRGR